jgi:hypothetical protein
MHPTAFYLTMNVAVGGTNGWFSYEPEKPWLDGSASAFLFSFTSVHTAPLTPSLAAAPRDFLQAKDQWYPSWPQDIERRTMVM